VLISAASAYFIQMFAMEGTRRRPWLDARDFKSDSTKTKTRTHLIGTKFFIYGWWRMLGMIVGRGGLEAMIA
jgi:hypothetical protein